MRFTYLNHRGVWSERDVVVSSLSFLKNPREYNEHLKGYFPGWFIVGYDKDRGEERCFALTNIKVNAIDGLTLPL